MAKENTYTAEFHVKGLDGTLYGMIPGLKDAMIQEYVKVYNMYCDRVNSGVTELLNQEFNNLYPSYFENNSGKDWHELDLYNTFMADGYMRYVVNDLNNTCDCPFMEFYIDPKEVVFTGLLKVAGKVLEPHITINFSLVKN